MSSPTVSMVAPATFSGIITSTPSGTTYIPDQYGYVQAYYADVTALAGQGFKVSALRDNFVATSDPTASNDNTQDYAVGSRWVNTVTGRVFTAVSVGTGAAVWAPPGVIGQILGANMNSFTDQPVNMFVPNGAHFRVSKITVTNASISLTTAAGGVYDATGKGGNAIVAAGQSYAALTAATKALDLTIALNLREPPNQNLYLSLTTGQGAVATADVYVFGDILAQ